VQFIKLRTEAESVGMIPKANPGQKTPH